MDEPPRFVFYESVDGPHVSCSKRGCMSHYVSCSSRGWVGYKVVFKYFYVFSTRPTASPNLKYLNNHNTLQSLVEREMSVCDLA